MRAQERIRAAVSQWAGVTVHPHRFGGIEFRYGKRELGHIHGDYLVDIPFPMRVRNELVRAWRAQPHHILLQSGWVSFSIKGESGVQRAIELLQQSYDVTRNRKPISPAR
jgi:hypothetical protein